MLGNILVHSVDKTHVVVETVELVWLFFLNIVSFNFMPTPNKSLRFTRFGRSYVNRTAVVLTNHCQSYTAFCLMCAVQKGHVHFFFFLQPFVPNDSHLRNLFLLSIPAARMLLTPRLASRRKYVK